MSPQTHYDVIIIGAGSVGVPAAMYIARSKCKVLVIDQFASPGQGSNKAAIGGARATHSDPAKIRLGLRSLEIISSWQDTFGQDVEWVQSGYSFVAYRPQEEKTLKDLLIIQKSYGLNIDWYDRDDFLKIIPDLNRENLIGGVFSPEDGNCSTLKMGHAFYDEARRAGVDFIFNQDVKEIITQSGRIKGVRTVDAAYAADVVINAAGPWANQVGLLVGLDHPVTPDSHEAAITEPVAPFLRPMVVDIRPSPGSANYYFYQQDSGQVIFCITPSPNIWGYDRRETSEFLPMVARRMVNLIPRLENIRVRRTWRGLYPMSPDGSPLVGWFSEVEGYLAAIGMCGQGFMLGPALGELLARMVTTSEKELSAEDRAVLQQLNPRREFSATEKLK
jgi:sarcosine oxidase, subunit beta